MVKGISGISFSKCMKPHVKAWEWCILKTLVENEKNASSIFPKNVFSTSQNKFHVVSHITLMLIGFQFALADNFFVV